MLPTLPSAHDEKEDNTALVTFNCANSQMKNVLFLPSVNSQRLANVEPNTTIPLSEQSQITQLKDNTFDGIFCVSNVPLAPSLNAEILRILKPGATFAIQGPKDGDYQRSLLYSGFTAITQSSPVNTTHTQWECLKSDIVMAAAPLKSSVKVTADIWSFGDTDIMDDGIELEDEDTLLDHETEVVSIPKTNVLDDCEVGAGSTRKPCKNCSCGRADPSKTAEKKKITMDDLKKADSGGCGSCHLGDAFRCGGCPYLGLPAFDPTDPGEAVKLALGGDDL